MTARHFLQRRTLRKSLAILGLGSLLGLSVSASVHPAPTLAFHGRQHATARNFTPAANSVVKSVTAAALLLGDEGVGNGDNDYIDVYDGSGAKHSGRAVGRASGDLSLVSVPLVGMSKGWYAVHWNVESADGHMAGGDNGSWWVFGVNTKTNVAPSAKMKFSVDVAAGSLPTVLTASLNGARTGSRSLTFGRTLAAITTVRLKLMKTSSASLSGAEFDWSVGFDKKTKQYFAIGAVPFPGVYRVTVQGNAGSTTGVWRSEVLVAS